LGERRGFPSKDGSPAFFQDANYHDQIVKERNKPTTMPCPDEGTPAQRSARDLPRLRSHGQRFDPDVTQTASPSEPGLNPRPTNPCHPDHATTEHPAAGGATRIDGTRRNLLWFGRDPGITSHSVATVPKATPPWTSPRNRCSRTRQIGHRTGRKLDERPAVVKRPSLFPLKPAFLPVRRVFWIPSAACRHGTRSPFRPR